MERLRAGGLDIESPVPLDDLLELGGRSGFLRRAFLFASFKGLTAGAYDHGRIVAAIFLARVHEGGGAGAFEFCMSLRPEARPHMLPLVRFAHLTLSALADTGAEIHCHVLAGNRAGERMARMTGFSQEAGSRWRFEGGSHAGFVGTVRRRQQGGETAGGGCETGAGTEPPGAGGCQ